MALCYSDRVANESNPKSIDEVAKKIGISTKVLKRFGDYVAKVPKSLLSEKLSKKKDGHLILVTSVTPTHVGEGKSVATIGLSMALNKLNKKSICCLSETSPGALFGLKGVASGGGSAQLIPAEEVNLRLTGDLAAVQMAQNLCAAAIDNSFFWDNKLGLEKDLVTWKRSSMLNDRVLRNVTVGGGGKLHGVSRKTGSDLISATECMAILSMSKNLKDLRTKIGKIIVGYRKDGKPITTEDLKVAGAMTVVLSEALNPNLVQTIENTPCFMHGSSCGNISVSSSSIISNLMALKLADYVVTETDFGADIGAEKFMNIKCRQAGLKPSLAVINCTVRAMKMHSGDFTKKSSGLPPELKREDLSAVDRGCSNLEKQVENLKMYGIPIVVSINRYETDSKKELDVIVKRAEALEVEGVAICEAYKKGSEGAIELANSVLEALKTKPKFRFLYPLDMNVKSKIERIARSMYGASDVKYSEDAEKSIMIIEKAGLAERPICMSKTYLSLSNNPKKKGRPRGFLLGIDSVGLAEGAGYICVRCDGANTLPGMNDKPRFTKMDIDVKTGRIKGLL